MPSTSGEGIHTGGDVVGEYRLGHPGGVVPVVLGGRVGGRPGDLRDRGDDALDAEPGELPLRGEAEVAALVGRERRPGEPIHPPGDLAPGVAGEPPRHGLAGVRVEGADGGRPQVDVHPERGRILWHGSLPTSLRRGCAYGTSTSLSQPRPAVTSGGSYLFSALGLGHSVCPSSTCDSATVRFGACNPLGTEEKGSFSVTFPQQFTLRAARLRSQRPLRYT